MTAVFFLFMVVATGLLSQTSFFNEKLLNVKELPGEARSIVWQMGFESWKERPWLGWGLENFNIPFAKNFNPTLPLSGDLWYDRVHNIVLDVLVTSGAIGLASYLAIFGISIVGLLRLCPKVAEKKNLFLPLGMIATLLVYFGQNLWVFDMISTYMMFFLSLAFIYFLTERGKSRSPSFEPAASGPKGIFPYLLAAPFIFLSLLVFYFGNIQPARASKMIFRGGTASLEETLPVFEKALQLTPMSIIEVPEYLSKKATGFISESAQNKELVIKTMKGSANALERALVKNPSDFRFYLFLGQHYNNFYNLTSDVAMLDLAEEALAKAIELSPKNQQAYWILAQTRLSQRRNEEALGLLQKSVDLEPDYFQSHWYMVQIYSSLGQDELALQHVKGAEAAIYDMRASKEEIRKLLGIYQELGDFEGVYSLSRTVSEQFPEDAEFHGAFAVAAANLGKFDEARDHAAEAARLNPSFAPQIDEFLRSLPR